EFRAAVLSVTHLGLPSPPTLKSTLFLDSSELSTFHLHTRRATMTSKGANGFSWLLIEHKI
ncbi:unnamed protein product, partial [Musa acuminata subsp. burmannicoides]